MTVRFKMDLTYWKQVLKMRPDSCSIILCVHLGHVSIQILFIYPTQCRDWLTLNDEGGSTSTYPVSIRPRFESLTSVLSLRYEVEYQLCHCNLGGGDEHKK